MMNEPSIDWRQQQEIFRIPISSVVKRIMRNICELDLISAERLLLARFGELDWESLQDILAHLVIAYEYRGENREAGRFERAYLRIAY